MIRPYQDEAIRACVRDRTQGILRQLLVLPCACGKTVIFSHLVAALDLKAWERALILVHRDELVTQSVEKVLKYNPGITVGIEKAQQRSKPTDQVVVASVQTIGRANSPRLQALPPNEFALVIIDEAHHAVAKTYHNVLKHFDLLKGTGSPDPNRLLLGVTATPNNTGGFGLGHVFDKIVYYRTILEMIREGWLTDIQAYKVWTDSDISGVSTRAGDFNAGQLERAVNTPSRNLLVLRKYQELADGLPAIAFTVDVQHAHDLAEMFNRNGVPALAVSGKTPIAERREAIQSFKEGRIKVMTNCSIFSEGTDLPLATVGLMTAPTKSFIRYSQQVGRILRPYPPPEEAGRHNGYVKQHAILIDFVDNSGRHELIQVPSLFGLNPKLDTKGKKMKEVTDYVEQMEMRYPGHGIRNLTSLSDIRHAVESIDLLAAPAICREAQRLSKYSWSKSGEGRFHLSLADKKSLLIFANQLGHWEVFEAQDGARSYKGTYADLREAFRFADTLVPSEFIGAIYTNARWRHEAPTEKQAYKLYHLSAAIRKQFQHPKTFYAYMVQRHRAGDLGWTKGAVSRRIDSMLVARS